MYRNGPLNVPKSSILSTEVFLDMYRCSPGLLYRSGPPYVPKRSCTELALPPRDNGHGDDKLLDDDVDDDDNNDDDVIGPGTNLVKGAALH